MLPLLHNLTLRTSLNKSIKPLINQRQFHRSPTTSFPFVGLSKGSKRLDDLTYPFYKPSKDSPDAKLAPIKPGWEEEYLRRKEEEFAANKTLQKNYPLETCLDEIPQKNRIRFGTLWTRYPYWLTTKSHNGLSNPAKREERLREKREAKRKKREESRKRWMRRKPIFPSARKVTLSEETLSGKASPLKALESIRVTQGPTQGSQNSQGSQ